MKVNVRVLVAAGEPTTREPPYEKLKQLYAYSFDSEVADFTQLDKQRIFEDVQEVCCQPVLLVFGSWTNPVVAPVVVDGATFHRRYCRYDWPNGKSLWVGLEIKELIQVSICKEV